MVQTRSRSDEVRAALPVTRNVAYLNTGTAGPLPEASLRAMREMQERELHEGRSNIQGFLDFRDMLDLMRVRLGGMFGCDAAEVAVTHHTTEGMNIALWGMRWHAGEEIVTTSLEHIGGLGPIYALQSRFGVKPVIVECGETGEGALDAITNALTERTRAVALSHVSYSTGYVLPVKEIARRAHAAGALVIVDGAQSAGVIPLDLHDLGVDAYAMPGQKWLCGPEGTGALYVAAAAMDRVGPTFTGGFSFESFDELGVYAFQPDARRFEVGSVYRPALAAMNESTRWIAEEVTLPWAYGRIQEVAAYCRRALEGLEGIDIMTPPGPQAGLVTITFPGWEGMAVSEEMADRGIVIRPITRPAGVRVATGFYNTEEEIDRLVTALREVQTLEPHEPRVTLH